MVAPIQSVEAGWGGAISICDLRPVVVTPRQLSKGFRETSGSDCRKLAAPRLTAHRWMNLAHPLE